MSNYLFWYDIYSIYICDITTYIQITYRQKSRLDKAYHLCYTTPMARKQRTLFTDQDYIEVLKAFSSVEDGNEMLIEVNEREHQIGNIKIPKYVFDFCAEHSIQLRDFLSCLLSSFVLEMESGLSGREKFFLKKMVESNLPTDVKNSVIKILIGSSK